MPRKRVIFLYWLATKFLNYPTAFPRTLLRSPPSLLPAYLSTPKLPNPFSLKWKPRNHNHSEIGKPIILVLKLLWGSSSLQFISFSHARSHNIGPEIIVGEVAPFNLSPFLGFNQFLLHPIMDSVKPGLSFWFYLGIISSLASVTSFLKTDFIEKTTGLFSFFPILIVLIICFTSNLKLYQFYWSSPRNQETYRFFRGYERAGKTIGFTILLFGNVGLFYFSEKSVAFMLTCLFLAFYCLCILFCIQPYTDFGALDFFVSASLNQTLSLFRLSSSYFWLGISAFIVIEGIRFFLEPKHFLEKETSNQAPVQTGLPIGPQGDNNPSPSGSSHEMSASPLPGGDAIGRRNIPVREDLIEINKHRFEKAKQLEQEGSH